MLQVLPGNRGSRSEKMLRQLSGVRAKQSHTTVLQAQSGNVGPLWETIWNRGVEKTLQMTVEKIKFLINAPTEVLSFEEKLTHIKSDLEKADFISDNEEEINTRVSQLRVLAFIVEDVIEVFKNNATIYEGYDVGKLITGTWCQLTTLCKLKGEIDNFNLKHAELPGEKPEFKEPSREDGESSNRLRQKGGPSSETNEDDIVGFKEEEHHLKSWLTQNERRGWRVIVSIGETEGAGKTSLAHKIYKNNSVASQFDCVAWVSVSQKCDVQDIWVAILEQIGNLTEEEKEKLKTEHTDIDTVRKKVDACLKKKDYLIILDDVRKKEDFDELMKAFPESPKKKCRILVTAHIEEVGRLAKYRLHLRKLNDKEAMELFLKKVYQWAPDEKGSVPKDQLHWASKILQFCTK